MLFKLQKQDVKAYLEENYTLKGLIRNTSDYEIVHQPSREYLLKLFTWDKGLYSGILYSRERAMDFILDFAHGSFQMGGVSGNPLKNTVTNIRNLFPDLWQTETETSNGDDYEAYKTIKAIGRSLGSMGTDVSINVGKGLFRALNYAPQIEQIIKVAPGLANNLSPSGFIALMMYARTSKPGEVSLQKLLGLSKGQYKTFISDKEAVNTWVYKHMGGYNYLIDTIQYSYIYQSGCPNKLYINLLDEGDPQGKTITEQHYTNAEASLRSAKRAYAEMLERGKDIYKSLPDAMSTLTDSKSKYIYGWLKEVDDERNYHEAQEVASVLANAYDNMYLNPSDWGTQGYLKSCLEVLKSDKQNLKHLVKYLYSSCYHQQAMSVSNALDILRDYYHMVSQYPGFVRYPRFLKTAHDVASRNAKTANTEADRESIISTYQEYQDLEGKFGDWCAVVLASPQEIIGEGNSMHHCVGSYVNYVSKGTSLILSLRKASEPEIACVTVELAKDKDDKFTLINQAFGRFDAQLTGEQNKALATFAKLKHLTPFKRMGGTSALSLKDKADNNHFVKMDLDYLHATAFADIKESSDDISWVSSVKSA